MHQPTSKEGFYFLQTRQLLEITDTVLSAPIKLINEKPS